MYKVNFIYEDDNSLADSTGGFKTRQEALEYVFWFKKWFHLIGKRYEIVEE